jgi:hypothetical protein
MRGKSQRGSAFIEMTLVGIPMIFVLISTVEVSRGMWIYSTLSFAAREASRYISVHGQNCQTAPNTCALHQVDLGVFINNAATGLIPDDVTVKLTNPAQNFTCTLRKLLNNNCVDAGVLIPPAGGSGVGSPIGITLTYPFPNAISMFWPGAGRGTVVGAITLSASSQDQIQY